MIKYLLSVYFLMFSFQVVSQNENENYVIDFITTKSGLSHNYVTGVVSDDLNLKWMGTENGITKFNGFDFDYIKPSGQFKELLNENIETLFIDKNSNLWIGTKSGGLSLFDIKNNKMKEFNHLIDLSDEGDLRVISLSQDVNGHIWVGTWNSGVYIIDAENDKLIDHFNYYQPIYNIIKDFKNNMWFCHANKVFQYDTDQKKDY